MQLVESSVYNDYRKPIIATDCADAIIALSGTLKINEVGDSICLFKKVHNHKKSIPPNRSVFVKCTWTF